MSEIGHAYTCQDCDHHFVRVEIDSEHDFCELCDGPTIYDGEEEMPDD